MRVAAGEPFRRRPWHLAIPAKAGYIAAFPMPEPALRKLPARFAPYVFGLLLSGIMTAIVAAIATVKTIGVTAAALANWPGAWLTSWLVAFPVVLVVAPFVRRMVARLCEPPAA